ncbi:antitoxin [Nonomuraea sp. LP-02]|uniref:antitoxin n=1 Tax=Nonomuraea sp. LP-02 TaxID=3097960 RepID=UPI002E317B8F|nr:antitoxin [Nonomuraea sp. LP-02]MED7930799.1 antitoxin [Nonomuraea sp. LP-02]
MSRIAEWLKKAENLARGHSKQADQMLDRAERFAKERTGHKYDEHIEKGADAVQRRYGGGTTSGTTGGTTGAGGTTEGAGPTPAEREQMSAQHDPTGEPYRRGPQG